jgi:hypothetical protein
VRNVEQAQQIVVPLLIGDVQQLCAGRVGHIGDVDTASGQSPEQERIDGAERELASLGFRPCTRHVIEQPADLGGREVRINQQPGAFADQLFGTIGQKACTGVSRAPILPHDRPMDRATGAALPNNHRLALVGDANSGEIARSQPGACESLLDHRDGPGPDLFRIVLDLTRRGEMLRELALSKPAYLQPSIEDDGPRRGRSLVDGEYITGHEELPTIDSPTASTAQCGMRKTGLIAAPLDESCAARLMSSRG